MSDTDNSQLVPDSEPSWLEDEDIKGLDEFEAKKAENKGPQSLRDFFLNSEVQFPAFDQLFDSTTPVKTTGELRRGYTVLFWAAYLLRLPEFQAMNDKWMSSPAADENAAAAFEIDRRVYTVLVNFRDGQCELDSRCRGSDQQSTQTFLELMAAAARILLWLGKEDSRDPTGNVIFTEDVKKLLTTGFDLVDNQRVTELESFARDRTFQKKAAAFLAEDKNIWSISAAVAAGILCNTYAHYKADLEKKEYLTAFLANVKAAIYLDQAARWFGENLETFDDLPCCKRWYSEDPEEWEIQRTINMWEEAKKKPIDPEKWDEIEKALFELRDVGWELGILEGGDQAIVDLAERHYDGDTYFARQHGFCEDGKRHQGVIRHLEKREEETANRQYRKSLEKSYFRGTWDCLADKTKQALLNAELLYDKAEAIGSKYDEIVGHYKRVFEAELRRTVFANANPVIDEMVRKGDLSSPPLSLSDMRWLLSREIEKDDRQKFTAIRKHLASLPVRQEDKKLIFTYDFASFLRKLNEKRNEFEHEEKLLSELTDMRNRTLGIDTFGYLPALARIKKSLVNEKTPN